MSSSDKHAKACKDDGREVRVEHSEHGFSMTFKDTGAWHTPVRPGLWERVKQDWRLGWLDPNSLVRPEGEK